MRSARALVHGWLRVSFPGTAQGAAVARRPGPPFNGLVLRQRSTFFSNNYKNELADIPADPRRQGEYMRRLAAGGHQDTLIALFESGRLANTEDTLGEYMKALVKTDRLSGSALLSTLVRGAQASFPPGSPAASGYMAAGGHGFHSQAPPQGPPPAGTGPFAAFASAASRAMASEGGSGAEALGTAKNPLITAQAEPSFGSQVIKMLKTFGLAFIAWTALAAFLDDKALGGKSGLLANPDLKPQYSSNTKFADVKGCDEAKGELEEIVDYLRSPSKFTTLGGKLPKGVLLVGPPGTGKTMLARAIAGEAGVPFFYCSGSEFEEVFVGVGARRVRDLFAAAKKHAPCIVFIDEIDAIGGNRNPKDQTYMRMTLNQLLVELDGFKATEGVIVVAATNFPEILDKALVRPGRFDRHVNVPAPDVEGRKQILASYLKAIPVAPGVDISVIARGTPGFSGADLANLVNVAALHAAKVNLGAVGMASLEYARDRILMGAERKSALITEKNKRITAYHEGGHALVALFTDGSDPVHKATIVPRGGALGMVTQLPEEDQLNYTRRQMLARLDVCMGGRVAEELIFGPDNITTGASSDFKQATQLARAMVTRYGMSAKLGAVSLDYDDDGRSMSMETRAAVESEVKELLTAAYNRARAILTKHEADLHAVASALLDKETLSGEQIQAMLAGATGAAAGAAASTAAAATANATKVAAAKAAAAVSSAAATAGAGGLAPSHPFRRQQQQPGQQP